MKIFSKLILLTALFVASGSHAVAAGTLDTSWLRLIKADFDPSCDVLRSKVGTVVAGNNGYRSEQWFMQTCRGNFEYQVAYYPPTAFPGRASPYEVTQITANAPAARPNNSFKPRPLRGLARVSLAGCGPA
jgi:hypothetical protein